MADQLVLAVRVGGGRAEVVVTRVTYLLITIYSSRITTVYDFGRGGVRSLGLEKRAVASWRLACATSSWRTLTAQHAPRRVRIPTRYSAHHLSLQPDSSQDAPASLTVYSTVQYSTS
jgi:hypothetical protein